LEVLRRQDEAGSEGGRVEVWSKGALKV
jgi:hypothetical protein